jgi:hypothetical protein
MKTNNIAILSDKTSIEVDDKARIGQVLWSKNGIDIYITDLLYGLNSTPSNIEKKYYVKEYLKLKDKK